MRTKRTHTEQTHTEQTHTEQTHTEQIRSENIPIVEQMRGRPKTSMWVKGHQGVEGNEEARHILDRINAINDSLKKKRGSG